MGENFDEAFGGLYKMYIYLYGELYTLIIPSKFIFLFYILENVMFCIRTDTYTLVWVL